MGTHSLIPTATRSTVVSRGFTLLEVVVSIVIMGVLAALVVRAYPTTRTQQQLILAQQQIQFLVREAQQRALNEDRDEACLQTVRAEDAKLCSDIGLWFAGPTIVMFADTTSNSTYDQQQDWVLQTLTLPQSTRIEGDSQSYVFRGTPPTISMYVNSQPNQTGTLTILAGSRRAQLTVTPYGQVEQR